MSIRNVYVEIEYTGKGTQVIRFSIYPDKNSVGALVGKIEYQVNVRWWTQKETTTAQFGQISIANNDGEFDWLIDTDASKVVIKEVYDSNLPGATVLATAYIQRFKHDGDKISIILKDKSEELDRAVQDQLYPASETSTVYPYPTIDYYGKTGTRKPYSMGLVYSVPPVLIHRPTNEYQWHHEDCYLIDEVYDNGKAVIYADTGDGKFVLSADPLENGVVTMDGRGGNLSGGTWPNSPDEILPELFSDLGWTDYDSSNVASLRRKPQYGGGIFRVKLGFHISPDDNITAKELLNWICDSFSGWHYIDKTGTLIFGYLEKPSSSPPHKLNEYNVIDTVKVIQDMAPNITTKAGGERNWKVLDSSKVAYTVPQDLQMSLTQRHRKVTEATPTLHEFYTDKKEPFDGLFPGASQPGFFINSIIDIYSEKRNFYHFKSDTLFDIGDDIEFTYPKADLDTGKNLVCVGYKIDFIANDYELTLWG
jgi:hypothetical protein